MVLSTFFKFLYPPPPSLFITTMSFISFASLANAGFSEIKGKNMQYSKFSGTTKIENDEKKARIDSKKGMLLLYSPAFLAAVSSFAIFPYDDLRFALVCSALTIHFFKRVLEVLFVHKYSGSMDIEATIVISSSYFLSTVIMIYCQHLTQGLPEPSIDLRYSGFIIFLVGIIGNFYHHILLSNLRTKGEKEYKIPQGGLFDFAICPHYLFEILIFVGISCTSQTLYAISFTLGTALYLMGRSIATRRWYKSKFDDFPKAIKALIPYIF
ncbi:very-long-chain enoyl-CoA reductase isoform X1 [Capsicum chacoense]